jgi:hypothetical protein
MTSCRDAFVTSSLLGINPNAQFGNYRAARRVQRSVATLPPTTIAEAYMIEEFGSNRIERFLKDNEFRYLVDQDGDFWVSFYGREMPDYRVVISVEGRDRDILSVRMSTDVTYTDTLRERIEGFVAGWNRRTRWPKTYLADDRRGNGFRVIGENSYPLGAGIHQELLGDLIGSTIVAGREMLKQLAAAANIAGGDELETWLRETG